MKLIKLTKGKYAKVDNCDYKVLMCFKWSAYKAYGLGNKYRVHAGVKINGNWKTVELSRAIMFPSKEKMVDHRNGDPLDNRRSNLRICTRSENMGNSVLHKKDHSTGIKGIYKYGNKWLVRGVMKDGVRRFVGSFACPAVAKASYNTEALALHGEFANFG